MTHITSRTGLVDETPCAGCGWPMCSCLCPADDLHFDTFNTTATFADVVLGQEFIEALTSVNEIATRIEATTHNGRSVNARREGERSRLALIWMADWEPVFIMENDV